MSSIPLVLFCWFWKKGVNTGLQTRAALEPKSGILSHEEQRWKSVWGPVSQIAGQSEMEESGLTEWTVYQLSAQGWIVPYNYSKLEYQLYQSWYFSCILGESLNQQIFVQL